MLSISELFTFFFVLHDCVICDCDRYHNSVRHDFISHLSSMFKKMKSKNEKIKNKKKKKIKIKFTAYNSDNIKQLTIEQ